MELRRLLLQALVLGGVWALGDIYIMPMWNWWLESQGKPIGFAEGMLPRVIIVLIGLIMSFMLTRERKKEALEEM